MSMEDPIKTTLDGLLNVLKIENVIGEPIESDGKILIPITRVRLGFGAGMGQGEITEGNESQGTGAAGGATVEPIAFVLVNKNAEEESEQIKVLNLNPPDPLNKAISEVSGIALELLKEYRDRQKKQEEENKRMRKEAENLYTP
jgi:uncharacterized spore protein YtfJ